MCRDDARDLFEEVPTRVRLSFLAARTHRLHGAARRARRGRRPRRASASRLPHRGGSGAVAGEPRCLRRRQGARGGWRESDRSLWTQRGLDRPRLVRRTGARVPTGGKRRADHQPEGDVRFSHDHAR